MSLSTLPLHNQFFAFFFQLNKEKHSHESTKKRLFANEKQFKQLNRGKGFTQIRVEWFRVCVFAFRLTSTFFRLPND